MLRWPVRSALYIDFENVPLPPEAIANWLAWLEDGLFEAGGRRRRFLEKRVYWNSHAERHRQGFERHGFSAVLVGKFSGLKNGADIRMAMDVVESTYHRCEIDEYVLLTSDSDFVPVLDRLRQKAKRTAIVVTEHRPNIHTTYGLHADVLIPSRRLGEAAQYKRPRKGWMARLGLSPKPQQPRQRPAGRGALPAAGATGNPRVALPPPAPAAVPLAVRPPPAPLDVEAALDLAARRMVRLMGQQPHNFVAQKRVLGELDRVPGFRRQGSGALLGQGSYRQLMREIARRDVRIRVIEQPGGGTGVVFIPEGADKKPDAALAERPDLAPTGGEPSPEAVTAQAPVVPEAEAKPAQPMLRVVSATQDA